MWTLCNEDGGVGEGEDHGGDARDGVDCRGKDGINSVPTSFTIGTRITWSGHFCLVK